jgi:hypothetical protein
MRGSLRRFAERLSRSMSAAVSLQEPQPLARPSSVCRSHRFLAPASSASWTCLSVIALQIQIYIGVVFSMYDPIEMQMRMIVNSITYKPRHEALFKRPRFAAVDCGEAWQRQSDRLKENVDRGEPI